MAETGLLSEVKWEWDGTVVTAPAAVGATTITVEDVDAISDNDTVWIGETGPYTVTARDETLLTLTLSTALTVAVDEGDPVVPDVGGEAGRVWEAVVILADADEPILVPLTVKDLSVIPEGTYDPPIAITVADDLASVINTPGRRPRATGSDLVGPVNATALTPTAPPAASPTLTVSSGFTQFIVVASDVAPTTTIEYHVSATSGFTPDATTKVAETRATVQSVSTLADGTPMVKGTTYYFRAIAKNSLGAAAPSPQVSAVFASPQQQIDTLSNNANIAANKIDNPTRTGQIGRWFSGNAAVLSVETAATPDGTLAPVLRAYGEDSSSIYSADADADWMPFDPSKAYRIAFWAYDEKPAAVGGQQFYFGLHIRDAGNSNLSVTPVQVSDGTAQVGSSNFYFVNYANTDAAKIGVWRRYIGYVLPYGTDPASMKNLGTNVDKNVIAPQNGTHLRVRILNWNNATGQGRYVWILNPTVSEVDPSAALTQRWVFPNSVNIDGGNISANSVGANQIAANAVTAEKIDANAITADMVQSATVDAVIALLGTLSVGSNITLDPDTGLTITLADGGLIQFPSNGDPAVITALLDAYQLTVRDNFVMQGTNNEIAGTLNVQTIPTAPKTAPKPSNLAVQSTDTVTLSSKLTSPNFTQGNVKSLVDGGGTVWYTVDWDSSIPGYVVKSINKTTGAVTTVKTDIPAINGSLTKIGSSYYALGDIGNGGNTYIEVFNSSFNVTSEFALNDTYYDAAILGTDGTNLLVLYLTNMFGDQTAMKMDIINVSTHARISQTTFTTSVNFYDVTSILKGTFDYGAQRIVLGTGTRAYVFDTTGANQGTQNFQSSAIDHYGHGWDGSSFYALTKESSSSWTVRKMSPLATSTSRSLTWTRYDNGAGANAPTAHETKPSPAKVFTQNARAFLRVETDPIGGQGGVDDPNAVRIYVDNHRQADLAVGATVAVYGLPGTSGAAAPASEGFTGVTGQTIGKIQSEGVAEAGGTTWRLSGDGTYRFDRYDRASRPAHIISVKSSDQSIPTATWTDLSWGTPIYIAGFTFTGTTGEYSADVAGVYALNFNVEWTGNSTGTRYVRALVNGSLYRRWPGGAMPGGVYGISGGCILRLNAGDKVRMQVYQTITGGGSLNVNGDANFGTFWDMIRKGDLS